MALTRSERLRAQDLEECGRFGEEFGLGAVEAVRRELDDRTGLRTLGWVAVIIGIIGLVVAWPLDWAMPTSPAFTAGVISGALLVAGGPLVAIGRRLAMVSGWMVLYSGGVAHFGPKRPQPLAMRWADVEAVTITTGDDEGTPTTSLTSLTLQGRNGTQLSFPYQLREQVAIAAHRALAPLIAASMIYTYDSGLPVVASPDVQVNQWGIIFSRARRYAWSDIGLVVMEHPSADAPGVTTRINLKKDAKGYGHRYADPSHVPNGIFLADLIAHAARQRGLPVQGYAGPGAGRLLSVWGPKALP
jgi:hypothetical protein